MHRRAARLVTAGLIAITSSGGLMASTVAHAATAARAVALDTTSQQADGRPGFAYGGGDLYVGWTGTNSSHNLNVAVSSYGSLSGKNTLSDTAIAGTGPGMATEDLGTEGPQVFLAWAGTDSSHHIYIGHYLGTGTLGCHTTLSEYTYKDPFLVNTGFDGTGSMYLLWTGTDSHVNVAQVNVSNCTSNSGQITISNVHTLTDTATAGPAAAYMNGGLWIYWPGTDSGHHIWAGLYQNSSTLADHTETAEASPSSLYANYNPQTTSIWISYRGTDNYVYFGYTSTTNGTTIVYNTTDGSNTTPYGVGDGVQGDYTVWDGFGGYDSASTLNINCMFC